MKIAIISIISLFIAYFLPISTNNTNFTTDEFNQICHDGYNMYHILLEEDTSSYFLKIIEGEYDNQIGYSILFIPSTPNEYEMFLKYDNSSKYLTPEKDSRGNSVIYNIILNDDINVLVMTKQITTYSYKIINNNSGALIYDNIAKGNNQGITPSSLSTSQTKVNDTIFILSIVFSCIIVISVVVILILFITKKGMFDQNKINEEFYEEHESREHIRNIIYEQNKAFEVEAEEIKEDYNDEEYHEVYVKTKSDDYEEIRDISFLLQEKGYNTNYKELTVEEKNNVMLELMKMRNFKEITEEEYKKEIIKLWM